MCERMKRDYSYSGGVVHTISLGATNRKIVQGFWTQGHRTLTALLLVSTMKFPHATEIAKGTPTA